MPPYKKSCGSVSSYVSVEHNTFDSFEVLLLGGVHEIQIPASNENAKNLKTPMPLTLSGDVTTHDNLVAFELIEFEKWNQLIQLLKLNPELASFVYPAEDQCLAFAPNAGSMHTFMWQSVGNLLLHEACRANAPIEVIQSVINANPRAASTTGHGGLLPLHIACASSASGVVVSALLRARPTTIKSTCLVQNAYMLPLHVACRHAANKEVLETLLAYYPEASAIRDGQGQLPMQYALAILSPVTRHEAVKCLEHGDQMRATADATAALLKSEFDERKYDVEDEYDVFITAMKHKYDKEIGDLNCQMLDLEFEKQNLEEEVETTKREMDKVMATFEDYKATQENQFFKLQEGLRAGSEEESKKVKELNVMIEELNATVAKLTAENEERAKEIEKLKVDMKEQEEHHTSLMETERKSFDEIYQERLKKEEELNAQNVVLEKTNAMKCRLLNKVAILANQEKQKQNEKIVDLVVRLQQAEAKNNKNEEEKAEATPVVAETVETVPTKGAVLSADV